MLRHICFSLRIHRSHKIITPNGKTLYSPRWVGVVKKGDLRLILSAVFPEHPGCSLMLTSLWLTQCSITVDLDLGPDIPIEEGRFGNQFCVMFGLFSC